MSVTTLAHHSRILTVINKSVYYRKRYVLKQLAHTHTSCVTRKLKPEKT